jgi:ribosomal subunit interface protein
MVSVIGHGHTLHDVQTRPHELRPFSFSEDDTMQVLVNSDHHITASESLSERVESVVTDSVDRFSDRITRVEVHLKDVNGAKRGDEDKRCTMEARIGGLAPIAVSHDAATLQEAIDGAADKLERALEHAVGRLQEMPRRASREMDVADAELLEKLEPARDARH